MLLLYGSQTPGWIIPGASSDLNFANANYWAGGTANLSDIFTGTRASTEYGLWADGHYSSFGSGVPVITDLGFWSWQAATNLALWNRDLTNANWTKSNTTVALDQTGIDNAANSASSVTATANNGTVTAAAITSASASRTQGWFIKRITGTGAVSVSQDGGTTYTDISSKLSTSAWYRTVPTDFAGLTQTVTNPQLAIKLATNGDKVAVDFVQLQTGSFLNPPILTTNVSASQAADVWNLTGAAATAALAAKAFYGQTNLIAAVANNRVLAFTGNANGVQIVNSTSIGIQNSSGVGAAAIFGSGTLAGVIKSAFGWDASGMSAIANGGTKATTATTLDGQSGTVYIGNRSAGDRALNGAIQRLVFGPTKGQFDGLTV